MAAPRDGGSAAGMAGTDRAAAGTVLSAWRGTSGILSASPKFPRDLPPPGVLWGLRVEYPRKLTHDYNRNATTLFTRIVAFLNARNAADSDLRNVHENKCACEVPAPIARVVGVVIVVVACVVGVMSMLSLLLWTGRS